MQACFAWTNLLTLHSKGMLRHGVRSQDRYSPCFSTVSWAEAKTRRRRDVDDISLYIREIYGVWGRDAQNWVRDICRLFKGRGIVSLSPRVRLSKLRFSPVSQFVDCSNRTRSARRLLGLWKVYGGIHGRFMVLENSKDFPDSPSKSLYFPSKPMTTNLTIRDGDEYLGSWLEIIGFVFGWFEEPWIPSLNNLRHHRLSIDPPLIPWISWEFTCIFSWIHKRDN